MSDMEAEQVIRTVGPVLKAVLEQERARVADEIRPLTQYVIEVQAALVEMHERVTALEQGGTSADQRDAYRGQIIAEAARLGVSGGELARAKKVTLPKELEHPYRKLEPDTEPDVQVLHQHPDATI